MFPAAAFLSLVLVACVNALKLSQMDRISAYLKTDRITAYVGTAHARRACRGGLAVCPSLFSPFVARSLC